MQAWAGVPITTMAGMAGDVHWHRLWRRQKCMFAGPRGESV